MAKEIVISVGEKRSSIFSLVNESKNECIHEKKVE